MPRLSVVLVNHCHPEMPHVCALRFRRFAETLTARGHRTVLLVEGSESLGASPFAEMVEQDLLRHDWDRPFVLACRPAGHPLLDRARRGRLPALLGKGVLAAHFALHGGSFADWVEGSRPYWALLAERFRPDVAWATFGNTGAWIIAQKIARRSRCPWGMDFKDGWSSFVPRPFRSRLPRRFRDAAFATALSETHAQDAETWFGRSAQVVYSGIQEDFLADPKTGNSSGEFRIVVTGSLYGEQETGTLVTGIGEWVGRKAGGPVSLAYFGGDSLRFREAAKNLPARCWVETPGFVPLEVLFEEMRRANVNAYIRSPQVRFHHKLFELLAADRPILCVPGEEDEAERIIAEVGGRFFPCGTADAVAGALARIAGAAGEPGGLSRENLARFTWDAQAEILERVLVTAASA